MQMVQKIKKLKPEITFLLSSSMINKMNIIQIIYLISFITFFFFCTQSNFRLVSKTDYKNMLSKRKAKWEIYVLEIFVLHLLDT